MPDTPPAVSMPRKMTRVALALLFLVVLFFILRWVRDTGLLARALEWIKDLGPWAPVVFVVLYVAAVVVFLPAAILTAGGGFIFGMGWGSVYVLVGATIAANLAFLLGRHIAREWIVRKLQAQPRFKALDEAVAREGWKIVALVRLAPVFPFSVTSYGFGVTRIPLGKYFLANFAMIPGTLTYVYFGSIARDLTERVATPPWIKWTVGALTVVVIFYVTRFAKRALTRKIS